MNVPRLLLGLGLLQFASSVPTASVLAGEAPRVFTLPAGRVTTTSATLRGMVNPVGQPATAWFEWGETTSYGNLTLATNLAGGSNVGYVAAEAEGVMPAPSLLAGGGGWTTNGEFALRFTGTASAAYRVFTSTNLVNWGPLGFATQLGSGQFEFREVPPTNHPVRFYRPGAP